MSDVKVQKIAGKIIKNKFIRVMLLLIIIFLIVSVTLITVTISYQKRLTQAEEQFQDAKMQLISLQKAVVTAEDDTQTLLGEKSFAPYSEIVPFISLLEGLFGIIDKDVKVIVKDDESEISANRYADYEVEIKVDNKKDLLFKTLNGLQKSKYLSKIMSLNMSYYESEAVEQKLIDELNLTVRLYFE